MHIVKLIVVRHGFAKIARVSVKFYHTSVVMLFHCKTSILCYFLFLYKFSVLHHSKCIGKLKNRKLDFYLTKIKPHLCLFIDFQVHLGWGMPCKYQGVVQWNYNGLGRYVVPKEYFCRDYTRLGRAVVPKVHFLDVDWSVCVM